MARQVQEKEKGIKGQTLLIHGQKPPAVLWMTISPHPRQISGAGSSGSKKSKKDPNKALEEFVHQQNQAQSDVSTDADNRFSPISHSVEGFYR